MSENCLHFIFMIIISFDFAAKTFFFYSSRYLNYSTCNILIIYNIQQRFYFLFILSVSHNYSILITINAEKRFFMKYFKILSFVCCLLLVCL